MLDGYNITGQLKIKYFLITYGSISRVFTNLSKVVFFKCHTDMYRHLMSSLTIIMKVINQLGVLIYDCLNHSSTVYIASDH